MAQEQEQEQKEQEKTKEQEKAELKESLKKLSYEQLIDRLANKILEIDALKAEIKELKENGSSEAVRKRRDEYNAERIMYRDAIKQAIKYLNGKLEKKKAKAENNNPESIEDNNP